MARLRVFVYRGEGVNPFSYRETLGSLIDVLGKYYAVDVIDSSRLRSGDWTTEAALLAVPGGRDVPYDAALRGEGNAQIRRFVEQGGSFLGLCAGAYYGAREVSFAKGGPLEVTAVRELGFYPGIASGPLYDPHAFSYDSEAGSRAATVSFGERQIFAYYNGGCSFVDPERYEETVRVVGRYTDATEAPLAAAVACQVGRGLAMLSGVHLEYRLRSLEKLSLPPGIFERLAHTEETRQELFREMVQYLVARCA